MSDLKAAEEYYSSVFGLKVLFRESAKGRGGPHAEVWATLAPGSGWTEAEAAGVAIGMVALGGDGMVLALLAGVPTGEQVYAIGTTMDEDDLDELRGRLPAETVIESQAAGWLAFVDRFGVRWQISSSAEFKSSGESRGHWLKFA